MKQYPSIPYLQGHPDVGKQLHTWAKLDGSNLRFEWSKKRGWYKFGTRRRLFDETFPVYGPAIPLFRERLADPLERIIRKKKWPSIIVYCEFYGPQSLGGQHIEGDPMELVVIDANPYKKGFLPPTDFLKLFGELGPNYLGYLKWGTEFLQQVYDGTLEGASFEGVVGKCVEGKKVVRHKAKSRAWKKAIIERYGLAMGEKLIWS